MYTKMVSCVSVMVAVVLTNGCGAQAPSRPEGSSSTRELLLQPLEMSFEDSASAVAISARQTVGADVTHRVALQVPRGSLMMHVDGAGGLVLDRLDVALDDVVISEQSLPPDGLHLTDLRVTIEAADAAEASWSADGSSALGAFTADVTFAWSLVTDGRVVPLAPQRIQGVTLEAEVGAAADGGVSVTLRGGRGGVLLRPAGVFELSDLSLELSAQG